MQTNDLNTKENRLKTRLTLLASVIVVAALDAACAGTKPTPTPLPAPTTVPTAVPAPTNPPAATSAGLQQAAAGEKVFNNYCSSCHGSGFSKKLLAGYRTPQEFFKYVRQRKPPSNPRSLTDQQYYDVTACFLSQQGLFKPEQIINAETAGKITLTE